jgi:hypothetical protein
MKTTGHSQVGSKPAPTKLFTSAFTELRTPLRSATDE